jgi:hypothetical protein
MPDPAAAPVWRQVSARPQRQAWRQRERQVSLRQEALVLAVAPAVPRRAAQLAAMVPLDRRPEFRSAQLVHPADRFAHARLVCRLFRVSAAPV